LDVILSESSSSTPLKGYVGSEVVDIDDAQPGLSVTFAVYLEFNSTTQLHHVDAVVRQFLNR